MTTPHLTWRKSSHSGEEYNCVEIASVQAVAPVQQPEHSNSWRKSSYSGSEYNCVETAPLSGAVALRDSKDPEGPKLVLGAGLWRALRAEIKAGCYDL